MSSQAAVAEHRAAPVVNSRVVAPSSGATTPQAAPSAARAVSAIAPPLAPAANATVPCADSKVSPAKLTSDGIRAIADGRYSDAIKVLEQAMALDANNATTRSNLTMAYNDLALQQAKTDQLLAMRTLRKSLTLNPNQTLARQYFDSMVRYFGRDPASFDDRVELANLARQDRDIAGVIYEYKAALAIHKDANVEGLLKDALGPQKVYPVRPPRPAVTVQPNAGSPQNTPKPNATPNAAPGASAPLPVVAPAQTPKATPAVPGVAPAVVPAEAPVDAGPATTPAATPPVTNDGANSSTLSNPNPN